MWQAGRVRPSRPPERPRLRKREIAFAVAMGLVAASGAALFLLENDGSESSPALAGPSEMTYQLGEFDEIATTGPQDVIVTYGDAISVRSEGSPDALAALEATVEDGRLLIRPKDRPGPFGDWGRLESATFFVTVPRLEAVTVAGSGDIEIDRIESESFAGAIEGSGELSIGALTVGEADFRIGGSGNIVAIGTARETHVSINGSGEVGAGGLRSDTASVSINGSGDVVLTAEDEAEVSIVGSGDVAISGPARCVVTQVGSGDVQCEGGAVAADSQPG